MFAKTETHTYQAVSLRQLWGSLATGAVLWSLHLVISYAVTSLSCEQGLFRTTLGGFTLARWLVLGLTLVAAVAVLYAGIVAYRHWQRLRQADRANGGEPAGRFLFMAYAGALLNGIFFLAIIVAAVPTLLLPLCA